MHQVIDPINKDDMLEQIADIRKLIESGEILSFAFVALKNENIMYSTTSMFWAHKPAIIGALHIKADELSQAYNIIKISEQLGL